MSVQRIPGFCALCRSRCGCISVVEDGAAGRGRARSLAPDRREPLREGPRGPGARLRGRPPAPPDAPHAAEVRPGRRVGRIGWHEALDWTAARMREVAERHGPEARGVRLTTPAGTAVSDGFPWIIRLVRPSAARTSCGARSCAPGTVTSHPVTFGVDIGTPDFERTGCLLLWGHNPSDTYLAQATAVQDERARSGAGGSGPAARGAGEPRRPVAARATGNGRRARARHGRAS